MLCVFDMDGTLIVQGSGEFSASTKLALQQLKENGHIICIASGREYFILDQNVLNQVEFDYIISSSGGVITSKEEQILVNAIEQDSIDRLLEKTKSINGSMMICCSKGYQPLWNEGTINNLMKHYFGQRAADLMYEQGDKGFPINGKVSVPNLEEYKKEFPELNFFSTDYDCIYDYVPIEQCKSNGIALLAKKLGISKEEIYAFGDSDNDVDMLQYAHVGIAMGNGTDSIKKVADYITDDIKDDGLYKACKHFHLI